MAEPVHIEIFGALRRGPRSPETLAGELRLSVFETKRHLRTLETLGHVTADRRVDGPVFELVRPLRFDDAAWAALTTPAKRAAVAAGLVSIQSIITEAADHGGFDRSDMHLTRTALELDEEGWREVAGVLWQTLDRMAAAERGAKERRAGASDAERVDATAVLMLFTGASDGVRARERGHTRASRGDDAEHHLRAVDVTEEIHDLVIAKDADWGRVVELANQLRLVAQAALAEEQVRTACDAAERSRTTHELG